MKTGMKGVRLFTGPVCEWVMNSNATYLSCRILSSCFQAFILQLKSSRTKGRTLQEEQHKGET